MARFAQPVIEEHDAYDSGRIHRSGDQQERQRRLQGVAQPESPKDIGIHRACIKDAVFLHSTNAIVRLVVEDEPRAHSRCWSSQHDHVRLRPETRSRHYRAECMVAVIIEGDDRCTVQVLGGEKRDLFGALFPALITEFADADFGARMLQFSTDGNIVHQLRSEVMNLDDAKHLARAVFAWIEEHGSDKLHYKGQQDPYEKPRMKLYDDVICFTYVVQERREVQGFRHPASPRVYSRRPAQQSNPQRKQGNGGKQEGKGKAPAKKKTRRGKSGGKAKAAPKPAPKKAQQPTGNGGSKGKAKKSGGRHGTVVASSTQGNPFEALAGLKLPGKN